MVTIETMHQEWCDKAKVCELLLSKLPTEEAFHKQWIFIKNEEVRAKRMVELIEKYLL